MCIPGCRCPDGQVIDEEVNSCVDPIDCTRKLMIACLLSACNFVFSRRGERDRERERQRERAREKERKRERERDFV